MAENDQDKPKIHIDDDWKKQAQQEKEKLAGESKQGAGQAAGEPGGEGDQREIPPASFTTLISSIMTQALMSMGGFEDPQTKKRYVDLGVAKFHIDTLDVLAKKTEGNLDEEEKKLLDHAQYELRMNFVQLSQRIQEMHAGDGQPGQPGGETPQA
ncbi:MAG: DUF1844 domain-containing protein [Phycisphaerae bacterium]